VLVVLLPQAVARPAQMMSKAVLTEITIDFAAGEYTLTGEMVVIKLGQPAPAPKTETVTGTAASVAEAINSIAVEQNKQVSFAHCTDIVLGEGLKGQNITDMLRYFLYRTELNNNCHLSWKEKGNDTTIEQFFKNYLGFAAAGNLSQGADMMAIFTTGRYAFMLDETQTDALKFINGENAKKRLVYHDEVLRMSRNTSRIRTRFIDEVPNVDITVKIRAELESNPFASTQTTKQIAASLKQKLKIDIESTLMELYRTNTADILGIYDRFHRFNTRGLEKYLEKNSFDDFLNNVHFNIKVDIDVRT